MSASQSPARVITEWQDARALRRESSRARAAFRQGRLLRRWLVAADVVGLAFAFAISEATYRRVAQPSTFDTRGELLFFVCSLPVWVFLAKIYGLYARDNERAAHSTADDVVGVFHLVTVGTWLLYVSLRVTRLASPDILKVGFFWLLAILAVPVAREIARTAYRRIRVEVQRVVIFGSDPLARAIGQRILRHPEYGLELLGFVDFEDPGYVDDALPPFLGSPEVAIELFERRLADRAIVSFPTQTRDDVLHVARALRGAGAKLDIVPRLYELVGPQTHLHNVEGFPLVGLRPSGLDRTSRMTKRCIDVVGAAIALIVTAPLFGYIALRIYRESGGPVLFRQRRLGIDLEQFTTLKFRTMRPDTGTDAHEAFLSVAMAPNGSGSANQLYKVDHGDAVTPFGRWLRRSSLDELPQLINVLRGEMSLVGPRPSLPYEADHFEPHHFERFSVKPGLTGLWQVTARSQSSWREAIELDLVYATNWSLWLDFWVLARTPLQLLRLKTR